MSDDQAQDGNFVHFGSKKPKAVVILDHLLRGGRSFKVDGRTFVLSSDYELCQLVTNEAGEEKLLVVFGVEIGPFVKLCQKLSDDETFLIGAATALTAMKSERYERRSVPACDRESG